MDWLAALRGLSGLAELGGFLPGAGQRLASVAFLVIEPADSGLFDKADLANVGRNYLAMAATMANSLTSNLLTTMNNVMPIGLIMKLVFVMMGTILFFHVLVALLKGVQEGHPKGLFVEVSEALWTHGPRVFIFMTLSLMVAGVSTLSVTGSGAQAVSINRGAGIMGGINPGEESEVLAMQQTLRTAWGRETDTIPPPMRPLKVGVTKAINAVSALDLISMTRKVSSELEAAAAKGQASAGVVGSDGKPLVSDPGTATDAPILVSLLKKAVVPLGVAGEEVAFIAAQYSMMKNLVASYIYLVLAWRMTLHFLPLLVCLAYFRSMQGLLISAMKHLLALSIAGAVMGTLASTLYDGKFWLGTSASGTSAGSKGLIGDIFKDIVIPAGKSNVFSPGTYPWVMVELYKYMAVIQVCALFGLVGVLLGEIYNLVRGALDGVMRSSHTGSLASTMGR